MPATIRKANSGSHIWHLVSLLLPVKKSWYFRYSRKYHWCMHLLQQKKSKEFFPLAQGLKSIGKMLTTDLSKLWHISRKNRGDHGCHFMRLKSHWSQMQFPSAIRIIIDKIAFIGLRDIFLDDDLKMQYRITIIHYFPKCHPKPIKMHLFVTVHNIVFRFDIFAAL